MGDEDGSVPSHRGPGTRIRVGIARGDQGVVAVQATTIALAVFTLSGIAAIDQGYERLTHQAAEREGDLAHAAHPDAFARSIFEDPGENWYAHDCVPGDAVLPESVTRFGLAAQTCDGDRIAGALHLSYEKLRSLRLAQAGRSPGDGVLDYLEARDTLDLDPLRDFRVETSVMHPLVPDVNAPLAPDATLGILYLADYTDTGSGWQPSTSAVVEAGYISALSSRFDPYVANASFDTQALPYDAAGDVVPDAAGPVDEFLPMALLDGDGNASLATYQVVVAGSGFDHEANQALQTRQVVDSWVDAGGTLILLGSHEQAVPWTDQLVNWQIVPASSQGSLTIVNTFERLLKSFNGRGHGLNLHDFGQAWQIDAADEDKFTRIASHGDAVASVSKDDAFGKGRVLATTFRPSDPHGSGAEGPCDLETLSADCEGLQILWNAITYAHEYLNVQFGPVVPDGVDAYTLNRYALVHDPHSGHVLDVRVVLYYY